MSFHYAKCTECSEIVEANLGTGNGDFCPECRSIDTLETEGQCKDCSEWFEYDEVKGDLCLQCENLEEANNKAMELSNG